MAKKSAVAEPKDKKVWRKGFPNRGCSAEAIADELLALRDRLGHDPGYDEMVEIAKDKSSPSHKIYEWDDKIGGQRYREQVASDLKSAIRVITVTDNGEVQVPLFVRSNKTTRPGMRYEKKEWSEAYNDEQAVELMERKFQRELESIFDRWHSHQHLKKYIDSVKSIIDELRDKRMSS